MTDTLAAPAMHLLEARHSRFIVHAAPVTTPEAALAFLAAAADADATHNCWAYRIDDAYRSSDDGEPAGTAGRPILAAIDGQGFDQVMVVVTRWYGGSSSAPVAWSARTAGLPPNACAPHRDAR